MPESSGTSQPERKLLAAALATGAALLVAPWFGHFDDSDAQLYQVVARNMAASRAWLDPQYLRHLYPHFREHLPFGIWPFAAADLLLGEPAARVAAALFSLGTLGLVAWLGRRLLGVWPAVAAVLVLACTESFFRYGSATRLDPLLMLLANAAAVPFLLGAGSRAWFLAAPLAVLVKGPFGLVPLVAAGVARAVTDRSAKPLAWAALAAIAAAVPLAVFLAARPDWWDGYLRNQLLASAEGLRTDGRSDVLALFRFIGGRFWPGLPLAIAGAVIAVRRKGPERMLLIYCAVMLFLLCLPARKVWHHQLVAWPGLALLAGAAAAPWLSRAPRAVYAAAALAFVASPIIGRKVIGNRCIEPASLLGEFRPGDELLIVSIPPDWKMAASLGAERRLESDPRSTLPPADASLPPFALVRTATGRGWLEVGRGQGWVLLKNALR